MSGFFALIRRDLGLAIRDGGALGTALGFFIVVITLMPLGLGPDLNLLSRIAPGILWIALLLSALLSMGRMFANDADDGSLEILATGPLPLELVVFAKALAHWLTTAVPLALAAPLLGLLLNLDMAVAPILLATLLIGTLAVSFLGAIGAALTLRAERGGLLISLLVLPLYVPTLIYGILTISAVVTPPGDPLGSSLILGAVSIASLVLGPVAAAAALRAQIQ
ncbi:MAG: heme exporter protein CcmB [Pseudomonadota bacterium]